MMRKQLKTVVDQFSVPYPRLAGPLAREFGLSFTEDIAYNGRGPKGSGKGAVCASWLGSEEVREDGERVFGGDPERTSFVRLDEDIAVYFEDPLELSEGMPEPESLIEVFEQFGEEEGYLKVLQAVVLQPALFAVAYVMAREECLAKLLGFLTIAMEQATARFGAEKVIALLNEQEVIFNGEYYASSIRALQVAVQIEEGEYRNDDRAFPPAAGRMLLFLGYTLEDILRRRPQPTPLKPAATKDVV